MYLLTLVEVYVPSRGLTNWKISDTYNVFLFDATFICYLLRCVYNVVKSKDYFVIFVTRKVGFTFILLKAEYFIGDGHFLRFTL